MSSNGSFRPLQSVRQLSIYAKHVDFHSLFSLAEVMALLQHHDTITSAFAFVQTDLYLTSSRGTSPMIHITDALQRMHQAERLGQVERRRTSLFHHWLCSEFSHVSLPARSHAIDDSQLVDALDFLSAQ